MNKFKLLFTFIFALSFFGASFGMGDDQRGGQKRPRQESSMSTSEQDKQNGTESKRRRIDSVDPDGNKIEFGDEGKESNEEDDLFPEYFWRELFKKDLAEIRRVVNELNKDSKIDIASYGRDFTADFDFYEAFRGLFGEDEKCVNVLELFLDKDLDWLHIFNTVLYTENNQAIFLLKDKVIDKINNFSQTCCFNDEKISFLPERFNYQGYVYYRPLSPLFVAIYVGNLELVALIVEDFGADVNAAQLHTEKAREDYSEELSEEKVVEKNGFTGLTPLQVAILFKNRNIIDYLISSGADFNVDTIEKLISGQYLTIGFVDNFGRNLLHIACDNKSIDLVKYLVSIGVDLNAKNSVGATPVDLALHNNFQEFFSYAFDSKFFDLNIDGKKFLSTAISLNLTNTAKYFIDKGVGLDFVDANGDTFVNLACKNKNYFIAYYLVKKGAKPDVVNKEGLTPLDIIISDRCYCLELIYKLVMNSKRDANNKVLMPSSLVNSKDDIYLMFCNMIVLLPSVYLDGDKPKDLLYCLMSVLNEYGAYADYYLNFFPVILDDLIEDCKKNAVNLCGPENENCCLMEVSCILWNPEALPVIERSARVRILLVNFLKRTIDLLLQNGYKLDEAGSQGVSLMHCSCCGLDEALIDPVTGSVLFDCLTRYLIDTHGARVDVKDDDGMTPLYYAVQNGKKSSIIVLLEHGADLNNLDGKGNDFYALLKKSPEAKSKCLAEYFEKIRDSEEKSEKIQNSALERKEILLKKIFTTDRCLICFEDFDMNSKCVFLVNCGHCLCKNCLKKSFIDNDGKLEACHECRAKPIDIEFDSEKLRSSVEVVEKMDAKAFELRNNIL